MIRTLIFLVFILTISSCKNSKPEIEETIQNGNFIHEISTGNFVDIKKWADEMINIDSTFINGKLKIISNEAEIINVFGVPEKRRLVNKPNYLLYLFNKDEADIQYQFIYENIVFKGFDNKLILDYIYFDDNLFLKSPQIELRKGLNVREICKLYPESCKLVIMGGNAWTGHIELRVSKKASFEDLRWFLIFRNELLVGIELHSFF